MSEIVERHYLRNGSEALPDAREALEWATETRAAMVDLKFCDLLGTWQHMTLPIRAFDESAFDEGLGFDGSSIRGWQGISESDMLLMPDPASAVLDPFTEAPTLSLICEIADPVTRLPYARDPRGVARRAEEYLVKGKPYCMGGGHSRWNDDCYDCSGSISFALAGAGLEVVTLAQPDLTPGH